MSRRLFAFLVIGGLLAAGVVVFSEWRGTGEPIVAAARPAMPEPIPHAVAVEPPRVDDLVSAALAQPLFSPTRQPAATAEDEASETPDFRLTGIVTEADRRLAIFAAANAKPLAVEEGGQVYGWHVDSISPREVSMSGPAGTRKMQPKNDPALKGSAPRPAVAIKAPPTPPPQPQRQNPTPPAAAGTAPARSPLAGGPPSPITFPMTSSSFPPAGAPRPRQ